MFEIKDQKQKNFITVTNDNLVNSLVNDLTDEALEKIAEKVYQKIKENK